jgi:hypothetical protein
MRMVLVVAVIVVATLSGCGGSGGGGGGGGSENSMTGEEALATIRSGTSVDYNSLNCPALAYLAQKYDSIADSASSLNTDNAVLQMQAMQARQRVIAILGVMGSKSCDIPDMN